MGIPHSNGDGEGASEQRSGASSASEGSARARAEALKKPATPPSLRTRASTVAGGEQRKRGFRAVQGPKH